MLASIHPLGERGRGQRWSLTVGSYVAASAAAGGAVGALAGAVGAAAVGIVPVGGSTRVALAATACAVAAIAEARGAAVPWVRRQVDETWLHAYRGWVYGGGFGAQLGAGVVTTVTTAAVPLFLGLALLTTSPVAGAVVGGTFGLARALPVTLLRGVHEPGRLWRVHARMDALAPAAARAGVTVVAGLALALAAGAVA